MFLFTRCCMFSFNPDWFVPVHAVCKLTSAIQRTCVTAALSFPLLCTLVITIVPNYYSVLQSEIHMDMEPGSDIASEGVENSQLAKLCSKCRSFLDSLAFRVDCYAPPMNVHAWAATTQDGCVVCFYLWEDLGEPKLQENLTRAPKETEIKLSVVYNYDGWFRAPCILEDPSCLIRASVRGPGIYARVRLTKRPACTYIAPPYTLRGGQILKLAVICQKSHD
jgi:hypothetical protein